jgi:hypothetical protein
MLICVTCSLYSVEKKINQFPCFFHELQGISMHARTNGEMPPPQQQRAAAGENRDYLCFVLVAILFFIGYLVFLGWLNFGAHGPRFTVASLSISGGQVAFNVSDSNPNRHFAIYYTDATWAYLRFYGDTVASGQAFPAGAGAWYQPRLNTTSIAGTLDVVDHYPSFSGALRKGRLPLRLQLYTAVSFRVNAFFFSDRQRMKVNCDVLVDAHGSLLRESVGAHCDTYVGLEGSLDD